MSDPDTDLLRGIHEIVNPQNVQSGMNYAEIEKSLINSGDVKKEMTDPNEAFKSELSDLAKALGLEYDSPRKGGSARTPRTPHSSIQQGGSPYMGSPGSSRSPYAGSPGSSRSPYSGTPGGFKKSPLGMSSSGLLSPRDDNDDSPDDDDGTPDDDIPELSTLAGFSLLNDNNTESPKKDLFPGFNYAKENYESDRSSNYRSSELSRRTDEEYRHDQVKSVMNSMGGGGDSKFISLEEANKEDEKTIMLEEIDSLRASLEEEDAKGIDKIPIVSQNDDYTAVENVLRRLRLKNDRARYTGLADEFLLWGAQGLEELFDGNRKWLGKNPDLTGWSKEVQVKLRRMRHDTSTLVSGVMHDYNIGPGMRILLELIPNLFMYARRRKQNYGKGNIYSDEDIARHMASIRDIDE